MVAASVERLALRGDERVLEVGTGSGYQAAVLGAMVPRGRVVTIERIAALAGGARTALCEAGATNVEVVVGDGSLGWPEGAPYDAIVVAAAAPHVPQALVEQLAPDGRLVVPVGSRDSQRLVTITRTPDGLVREESDGCVYVPLVGADAFPR
jgi:protein-L-isoaspartate(D-aspartate) O-methyltransferase